MQKLNNTVKIYYAEVIVTFTKYPIQLSMMDAKILLKFVISYV